MTYVMTADDLWCTTCNRGAEGCMHPIELQATAPTYRASEEYVEDEG